MMRHANESALRPVLGLDVDGVLALAAHSDSAGEWRDISAWGRWRRRICVPHSASERLAEFAVHFEIVWVTAWGHTAHTSLQPVLGLPEEPWAFVPVQFGQAAALASWAGERPWVLVHDGVDTAIAPAEAPHVVTVNPERGIDDVEWVDLERALHAIATTDGSPRPK